MKIPKVTSQKSILKDKVIEVKEEKIEFPNGKKKTHHNVYRAPTVSVFPLTDSYDLYLISQYRYLHKKVSLEAMSGFIEENEVPTSAAKRELKEETGLTALEWRELPVFEIAGSVLRSQLHLFIAKNLTHGETDFDDDEDITLVKLPLETAVNKVVRGEINHAASAIGILLLDRLRRENKL